MAVNFLQDIFVSGQSTMTGQLLMDNAQILIDMDAPGSALTWRESDSTTVAGQLRAYVNRGDLYLYNDGVKTAEITASTGSFVPDLTITNDLIVSGGDITLGGTGRIQGIDTVTDGTDAVNKNYVDNAITVDGSGAAGQVTFWTDADTLSGENNLYWDSTNDRLGIGMNSPNEKLEIGLNSSSGTQSKIRLNYWDGVENISQLWLNGQGSIDVSFNTTSEGTFSIRGYDNSSFTTYATWSGGASTLGRMTLPQYGSGSFTGTATKMLAVTATGIVVEETLPTSSDTTYDLTVPTSTTAIRLAGSDATNDDVTISGTTNETEVTRISATELRVGLPTDVTIAGTTTTNNIIYNTPTGTSTVYRGELVDFGGFEGTVSAGDLVVLRHTLGLPQWYKADYNSSVNATGMLGIYNGTDVLVRGYVQNSSFSFTTSGVPLYMGASGAISTAAPTGNGDFVRIIGYVADAANDRIYICPDNTWVEITA